MTEDIASAITVKTVCASCSLPIHSIPEKKDSAYCLDCARANAGITWGVWDKVGEWHPGVDYTVRDYSYIPDEVFREPFPEPVTTSRQASGMLPVPGPVMKLAEFAREHSWEVRTQYSQGCMPHATTGKPGVLKDLIGLRFGAHPTTDRQAYAVYSRTANDRGGKGPWTWASVAIWGPDLPPYLGCGITELKEYLSEPDIPVIPLLAWVAMIEKAHAEHAAEVKARPKTPAKPREDHA